jgi:hypothetical protein
MCVFLKLRGPQGVGLSTRAGHGSMRCARPSKHPCQAVRDTGLAHHKSPWSVDARARQRARIARSSCLYRIETVSKPVMTYLFSCSDTSNTIQQHAHFDIADNDTDSRYTDPYIHVTRFKRVPKELSPKVLQARSSRPPAPARASPPSIATHTRHSPVHRNAMRMRCHSGPSTKGCPSARASAH